MTYTIEPVEIGHRKADNALFCYLTEPGREIEIAYRLWVLRGPAGTILVDTGARLAEAHRRGITQVRPLAPALAEVGVEVDEVETIVLTHLHWDHAWNRRTSRVPPSSPRSARSSSSAAAGASIRPWTGSSATSSTCSRS